LYYRLKQIDEDGRFEFSKIIKIESTDILPPLFNVYHQPGFFGLNLQINTVDAVQGKLYNQSGKLIKEVSLSSGWQTLDLSDLAMGIYLLEINENGRRKQVEKVLWFF
jgi:hypothetical protein